MESPSASRTVASCTLLSSFRSSESGTPQCFSVVLKTVKVAVAPSEDCLESVVQAAKQDRARDFDSSPDRWSNFFERDPELERGWRCLGRGHRNIVNGSSATIEASPRGFIGLIVGLCAGMGHWED